MVTVMAQQELMNVEYVPTVKLVMNLILTWIVLTHALEVQF